MDIKSRIVLYSFDVFDTIITRNTATPAGIFALVERELLTNSSYNDIPARYRENFFILRRNAGKLAAAVYKEATTIDAIYNILGCNKDISVSQLERIKQLELETEYANSVPVNENIEKIRQLRQNMEKVAFISDMYLSSGHIRKLICKHAPDFEDIPVYVSCEQECTKTYGELFEKVRECENVEFKDWVHTGDNLRADVEGAKKSGITAIKYDYPALHSFEKELLKYYEGDAALQVAIGTARNVRMKKGIAGGEFDNEFVYGCSYGAPMIYSYISWVLKQAVEKGIKRLYFVSRDGYVPKIVADYLIERYELDIQTKYIYGSRKAWISAAFKKERDLPYCCRKIITITNYFDVPIDDIKTYIPNVNSEMFLSPEQMEDINKDVKFKEYLEETQKDKSLILQRYLLQELDFSNDNFAFVEMQGSGLSMSLALSLLKPYYQGTFHSFWSICVALLPELHNLDMYTYLYSNMPGELIENISRAPHGIVMGYEEEDGKIVSVFGDKDSEDFDFEAYIDGVKYFTAEYAALYALNDDIKVFNKYFERVLQQNDPEVMDFHSIFRHNKLEMGNGVYWNGKNMFLQDVVSRLNTIFNGLKIAVYGAGEIGREFRHELGNRCAAWFDAAYEDYIYQGYNVRSPYEISADNERDFDVIIVAIHSQKVFDEVKEFLISASVPVEKIRWIRNI